MKIHQDKAGYMTKMAAMPIYVKTLIRTHLAYIANAKKSCYIKQQFTVLKARAS